MAEQCAICGDAVGIGELNDEGHGRCCHNLPQPWHRGREGLYNQPTPADSDAEELDHHEDEESEEDTPHCHECGSRHWIIRFSGETRSESQHGDPYVYYEDISEPRASCADCGVPCQYTLELT